MEEISENTVSKDSFDPSDSPKETVSCPSDIVISDVDGLLEEGEEVILQDSKDRRYLVTLKAGKTFHSHSGVVEHDMIIGLPDASYVKARYNENSKNEERKYLAIRPTLADVVLKMPRGAQVIYPKDLGAIIVSADIYPGARVLESGVGSGALSMTLLRAGANLVGYELREDFIEVAKNNITKYSKHIFGRHIDQEELFAGTGLKKSGSEISLSIQHRDIYQGIDERGLDRIVLDLPEPWRVLPFAKDALKKGGIFLCYLPTINQTATFRSALKDNGFILAQTFEVLHRSWHIEGQSVRPDHRMVAHTGFITTARLLNTNQM